MSASSVALPSQPASKPAPGKKKHPIVRILSNPWILAFSLILGGLTGHYYKDFAVSLIFPGELYLSMFQMSVIPIISTSIIVGLARMLRSGSASHYLGGMIGLFVITVLVGSSLGLVLGLTLEPGHNLGKASEAFIGQALLEENSSNLDQNSGLQDLFSQLVPANVFEAYSSGKVLGIIFASVLLGAAMGMSRSEVGERFLEVTEGMKEAFGKILGWVVYGLPIGVFFLIAGQVSRLGMEAVLALSKLVLVFYLGCLLLWLFYALIMRAATGFSFSRIFNAVGRPVFVSFSAASAVASVPLAQKSMSALKPPVEVVNFVLPLSVAMNRHSYALLFALTAVFLAQLFGKTLDLYQAIFILLTAALVGSASAGRLAVAAPMITYVLVPLDIPASVAMTIFLTIGTILDPMIQSSVVFGSCANTAILGKPSTSNPNEPYNDEDVT